MWAAVGVYGFLFILFIAVALFWRYRYRIFRGRMRLRILSDTGKERSIVIKSDGNDGEKVKIIIFGKERELTFRRGAQFFTGPEEMPTLEYNAEDAEPIMRGSEDRLVSSIRFREVAENTVMRDLLESFRKKVIDNATALIISVVVTLLAALLLGIFINEKISGLEEKLPQSGASGIVAP